MARARAVFAAMALCACGAAPSTQPARWSPAPVAQSAEPRAAATPPRSREAPLPSPCDRADAKLALAEKLGAEGFAVRSDRLLAQVSALCPAKQAASQALVARNREATAAVARAQGTTGDELWTASQQARRAGDLVRARRLASLATRRYQEQGTKVTTWLGVATLGVLALSNDGSALLARSEEGDLVIVDAKKLEPRVFLESQPTASARYRGSSSAGFSANGGHVAVSSLGGVELFEAASGAHLRRFEWASEPIERFQFASDGASIVTAASAGFDVVVRRFDVKTGDSVAEYRIPKARSVTALAVSASTGLIAVSTSSGGTEILEPKKLTKLRKLGKAGANLEATALAFSATGHRIASISAATSLDVWDTTSGAALTHATLDRPWRTSILGFSQDGSRVRVNGGTWGEALMEIDAAKGQALASRAVPRGEMVLSPNGAVIAVSEASGLYVVDATNGAVTAEVRRQGERLEGLAVANGHLALARRLRDPDRVEIFVAGARTRAARFFAATGYKAALALSPNGARLAGSFGARDLSAWDVATGKVLALPGAPEWVDALAFDTPDSLRGAGGGFKLLLFSTTFGAAAWSVDHVVERGDVAALCGGRAVVTTRPGAIDFDFRSGKAHTLAIDKDVRTFALSGDSSVLVTASARGIERTALPGGSTQLVSGRCTGGPLSVSEDGSVILARCSHRELSLFSPSGIASAARDVRRVELSPNGRVAVTEHDEGVSVFGRDLAERVRLDFAAAPRAVIARAPSGEVELFGEEPPPAQRSFCRAGSVAAPLELCEDALYRDDLVSDALAE